ncbi:RCC1 domain-containing protein [Xanthomonas sp. NCPPB 2632]|uniref:RCC1 domain-containing protein n=1 Tax=Xanthomonas sp. NCPPB 2632 TaxID=3240912 RepID=UPI003517258B
MSSQAKTWKPKRRPIPSIAVVVALTLIGIGIVATSGGVAPVKISGSCPERRTAPVRVSGMDHAVAIAFQGNRLVALDVDGQLWSYDPRNSETCESVARRIDIQPETSQGQATPPRLQTIAASSYDGIGITSDGRLAVWNPENGHRACPDGGSPVACTVLLKKGVGDVEGVAGSASHVLVTLRNGNVMSMGMNDCGQLGRAEAGTLALEQIPSLIDVVAVATGKRNSMALDRHGRVWTWGNLSHPLIGSSTPFQPTADFLYCSGGSNPFGLSESPAVKPAIVDDLPFAKAIASFHGFNLVLDKQGHVWGWGNNDCGQVGGDPSELSHHGGYQPEPQIIAGLPAIQAIAAGRRHALFLGSDDDVWATGDNGFAELGRMEHFASNVPACVSSTELAQYDGYSEKPLRVNGFGRAIAIAAGEDRSAAVDVDGHVWLCDRYP